MRSPRIQRFLACLFLTLVCAYSVWAVAAFVQGTHAGSSSTSVTSEGVAFGSNNTAGNLIWIGCTVSSDVHLTTGGSDTHGNTYAVPLSVFDSTLGQTYWIAYAMNIGAGANTPSCTWGGGSHSFAAIDIHEVSGLSTTLALDQKLDSGTVLNNANPTMANVTTTTNGQYIACMVGESSGEPTAGAGYNIRETDATISLTTEDQVQSTAGAIACAWVNAATRNWHGLMVTFSTTPISATSPVKHKSGVY